MKKIVVDVVIGYYHTVKEKIVVNAESLYEATELAKDKALKMHGEEKHFSFIAVEDFKVIH